MTSPESIAKRIVNNQYDLECGRISEEVYHRVHAQLWEFATQNDIREEVADLVELQIEGHARQAADLVDR